MAALKEFLPLAKSSDHSNDPWFKERFSSFADPTESSAVAIKPNLVPPYGKRSGLVPRKPEDLGNGGAFPEIHVAQYPLGMGRKNEKPGSQILPLMIYSRGKVAFDAIVKLNENSSKIVYSKHEDLVPKIGIKATATEEDDSELEEIEETIQRTKATLEKIVNVRLSVAQPKNVSTQSSELKFIKYKPSQQSATFNSGAKERIIRMVEMIESLDMRRDVHDIFKMTPHDKQVMTFSATLNKEIRPVCKRFMQDPMEIYVDDEIPTDCTPQDLFKVFGQALMRNVA